MLTTKEKIIIRSKALAKTRAFFSARNFLETDVPICSPYASIDAFIDLFEVKDEGFLHSSPELAMKKLLCSGLENIYFLGHVFRKEEQGSMHSKEFTMLEYYRANTSEKEFLEETIAYLSLFIGERNTEVISFEDAMEKYVPKSFPEDISSYSKQEQRHYLFSHYVEKHLGNNCYTIINDFPEEEASLAKVEVVNGKRVAKRFEIFVNGIELANGFSELSDESIARNRFIEANKKRIDMDKASYPIDEPFLKALKSGLPKDTYGIAIGFDRLLMIANTLFDIKNIII